MIINLHMSADTVVEHFDVLKRYSLGFLSSFESIVDGKGCWRDNVFVERLWRSVKYEEVYLHAYDSMNDAKRGLGSYLTFYNQNRPHSSIDDQTPDEFYFNHLSTLRKAA